MFLDIRYDEQYYGRVAVKKKDYDLGLITHRFKQYFFEEDDVKRFDSLRQILDESMMIHVNYYQEFTKGKAPLFVSCYLNRNNEQIFLCQISTLHSESTQYETCWNQLSDTNLKNVESDLKAFLERVFKFTGQCNLVPAL